MRAPRSCDEDHLSLEEGATALAGRDGVTVLQPPLYSPPHARENQGQDHPTSDCFRQSDPPPAAESVQLRLPCLALQAAMGPPSPAPQPYDSATVWSRRRPPPQSLTGHQGRCGSDRTSNRASA